MVLLVGEEGEMGAGNFSIFFEFINFFVGFQLLVEHLFYLDRSCCEIKFVLICYNGEAEVVVYFVDFLLKE